MHRLRRPDVTADDVEIGQQQQMGPPSGVTRIAVTPDGRVALVGLADGRLEQWDLGERNERTLVAVAAGGTLVAQGFKDGTVHVKARLEGTAR